MNWARKAGFALVGAAFLFAGDWCWQTYLNKNGFRYWFHRGITSDSGEWFLAYDLNPDLFTQALDKWKKSDGDQARELAYFYRGLAYSQRRDEQAAIADFSSALALDDKDYNAYYHRGWSRRSLKQFDQAIADATAAIVLSPVYDRSGGFLRGGYALENAYILRALSYEDLGRLDQAAEDYSSCIAQLRSWQCYSGRAKLEDALGNYRAAIKDYTASFDGRAAFDDDQRALAADYDRIGDHEKAEEVRGAPHARWTIK